MKSFMSLLVIVSLLLVGLQSTSYAKTIEPWEEELLSCIEQKNAASIHITVDNSGSTQWTDPKGYRGISTSAITLGLQKIVSDIQTNTESSNLDIEISASGFANSSRSIIGWTNLAGSPFTKENFSTYNSQLNDYGGFTSYTSAINIAKEQFLSKSFPQSCDIWIFMTDGEPNEKYFELDPQISQLENDLDPFLIGVILGEKSGFFDALQKLLGEKDGSTGFDILDSNGNKVGTDKHTFLGINRKAKVFKAENATDLLSAFLNIGSQLRSAAFDSSVTDLESKSEPICTEDEECSYAIKVVAGTQYVEIRATVTDPGNQGDVTLLIEPPAALNINDALKKINGDLKKAQFGDTYVSVTWITDEFAEIIIEPDKDKNSWVGEWRFSLKADNPNGRVVTWTGKVHTKLVPNLPKTLSLRDGQKTCIDITYKSDTIPSDADVKLLIIDPFDGSTLKSIKATETRRGHQACIVPDGSLPNKIKLETDITYKVGNETKKSDTASTDIIEILEAPTYNTVTGPLSPDRQEFKGEQGVEFQFEVQAGNIDSVLNVSIRQLTSNLSPNVDWTVKYKGDEYQLGTEDFPIKISANENEILTLVGDPYEAINLDTDTMYEIVFKSSIPAISAQDDVESIQINSRFLDVLLFNIVQYAAFIFLIFLLAGLISSYLYSSFKSGLVFDKNIRTKSYPIRISKEGIDWVGDNFYNDTFDNTRILSTTAKKITLGNSIKVQFKQKLFPFMQDSSAEISSRASFVSIYNKEFDNKKDIKNDINKIWVFELDSASDEKVIGNLTIVANNEQTFNLLKDAVPVLQNIDYSSTQPSSTPKKKNIKESEVSDKNTQEDTTPPGSGGPPPPGSGGPPPPIG
ncbi:hypothetical protein N8812_02640 [Acidimicrobiia bacterium]|nr:hypothetical protein [Acidimicrobiia bacterium]